MLVKRSKLPLGSLIAFGWMPGSLKVLVYRLLGYRIGRGVSLGLGSVIVGKDVEIGPESSIGLLTIIRGRKVTIGPRVRIGMATIIDCPVVEVGEGTRINNQVVVGGMETPQSAFRIGRNCILMEWSFVNTTLPVTIGDDVGIGGHCLFFTHGMWPNTFEGFPSKFAPITIDDQAWLAWRVSVLPGVTIGRRSIVSSDACVVRDVPSGALAAGVPAKVLQQDESFVSAHGPEENSRRLRGLLDDFSQWLFFHGIKSEWRDDATLEVEKRSGGVCAVVVGVTPDLLVRPVRAQDCFVSLVAMPDAVRKKLDDVSAPWLDVQAKTRSIQTSDLADEVEEFLHRGGLRLLKYTAWSP